jgi:glycosyltransferase involved in cell wall biosynthesis
MSTNELKRNFDKRLAVIIPAMNEQNTMPRILGQIRRLKPDVIVVVVNGSTDKTAEIARSYGAMVKEYVEPLGNDVGRAVGAMAVEADTYLFTDADVPLTAEELLPFVVDVENGADMALNSLDWLSRYPRPDAPSIARYFLNVALKRRDLGLENVLTIPHAFSHRAVTMMGKETLANPLLATAFAIRENLTITISNWINVLKRNKKRINHNLKEGELLPEAYQRMHGDTVEALDYLIRRDGVRGGYPMGNRDRSFYSQRLPLQSRWTEIRSGEPKTVSVVMSVTKHSRNLSTCLESLTEYGFELIPIVHDGSEYVKSQLIEHGLPFIDIPKHIGHDVAFAIGAELAQGDAILFYDANLPMDAFELIPFAMILVQNKTDIAITDHSASFGKLEGMHPVHIGNCFMNIVGERNWLTTSSMMLPPYGLTRDALNTVSPISLMSPCLAHMRAIHMGLRITPTRAIDYMGRVNSSIKDIVLNEDRILGDFMEGLAYWNQIRGFRGGFHDGNRQRHVLTSTKDVYQIK